MSESPSKSAGKQGSWWDGFSGIVLAFAIAMTIRWGLIEAYVIPSGSMLPTLLIHDHIFVNKFIYGVRIPYGKTWLARFSEPKRGDIIVFRFPENEADYFIKRVIGTPGDKVLYENGVLYINDQKIEKQPPIHPEDYDWVPEYQMSGGKDEYVHFNEVMDSKPYNVLLRRGDLHVGAGPLTVPNDMLFVMGDNRDASNDSRYWGFVPRENVLGRAMFVWLSCEQTLPVLTFLCNPATVRWSRFFHSIE